MEGLCDDLGGRYGGLRWELGVALAAGCWAAYSTATVQVSEWLGGKIRCAFRDSHIELTL